MKGPHRRRQRRLDRRLEGVAEAVGGGYCRLQMPLKPALGVNETVAGHRLGALEEGSPSNHCPTILFYPTACAYIRPLCLKFTYFWLFFVSFSRGLWVWVSYPVLNRLFAASSWSP